VKWLEEVTNVDLTFELIPYEGRAEKLGLILNSGNYPDVFLSCGMTSAMISRFGVDEKMFLPLNDLIEEHGTFTKKMFAEFPGTEGLISQLDGNIYSLPVVNECFHCTAPRKFWINQAWLDNLGLKMPTTLDELYEVLVAFRDQDANGNGDPNDEIPLAGDYKDGWYTNVENPIMNAFCYYTLDLDTGSTTSSDAFGMYMDGDTVCTPFELEAFRDGVKYVRKLVEEDLLYVGSFTQDLAALTQIAESDRLPALIVDSFGDVLVLQCLALGMERFKQDVVDALVEEVHPQGIYERSDVPVRRLEGLEQLTGVMYGTVPDRVEMVENGVHFWVDVKEGQKTGFFLDQKENRAAIAPFVKGKTVLDCFTHTGSFALHAGHYGAKEVTGVDISAFACEFATENARLNGLENVVHFVEANAFDLLAEQSRAGIKYDVVILDPPAFTKTRSAIEAATRGYKEINLRAMKMVRPGGYLITCSCSQHILPDAFMQIVRDAAHDAHVQLRQVEYRTQGRDHPILPAAPETQYLKCGIFQIFD
jgi:23S rRNA (cytosine1962-C5)-methyltransferase